VERSIELELDQSDRVEFFESRVRELEDELAMRETECSRSRERVAQLEQAVKGRQNQLEVTRKELSQELSAKRAAQRDLVQVKEELHAIAMALSDVDGKLAPAGGDPHEIGEAVRGRLLELSVRETVSANDEMLREVAELSDDATKLAYLTERCQRFENERQQNEKQLEQERGRIAKFEESRRSVMGEQEDREQQIVQIEQSRRDLEEQLRVIERSLNLLDHEDVPEGCDLFATTANIQQRLLKLNLVGDREETFNQTDEIVSRAADISEPEERSKFLLQSLKEMNPLVVADRKRLKLYEGRVASLTGLIADVQAGQRQASTEAAEKVLRLTNELRAREMEAAEKEEHVVLLDKPSEISKQHWERLTVKHRAMVMIQL
jgi:chromosome segregation ATPase